MLGIFSSGRTILNTPRMLTIYFQKPVFERGTEMSMYNLTKRLGLQHDDETKSPPLQRFVRKSKIHM